MDPALSEGIETHHIFHRRSRVPGASYALYLLSATRAYRRVRAGGFRPDVIHAHVYGAGVPAALVATGRKIPFVLTEQFTGFPRHSLSRMEAGKARYAYKRAARALPVSRHLQEAIRSYGIHAPFEVVPNVVDTSLFFPPDTKQERADRRLLFVGNLEPLQHKGFPTLLRALTGLNGRTREWHLDVIGDGPERAAYESSTVELQLQEHVRFHGSRPKPVIAEMMRDADLFVLPSRFDNLPCVIVEALASGLPVVSTTVGGIPELVDDRSGRLVPPDDPAALTDGLQEVIEGLGGFDRRAIGAAARDRFSLQVVGEQLNRIYEAVVAESDGDAGRASRT